MTKTKQLITKWKSNSFQSSSGKTEEFKTFSRNFKSAIKEQIKGEFELESFTVGHFYLSGYLRSLMHPDQLLYFSTSDVRYFQDEWVDHILIRTAKNTTDYSGGRNHYTTIASLREKANQLIESAK